MRKKNKFIKGDFVYCQEQKESQYNKTVYTLSVMELYRIHNILENGWYELLSITGKLSVKHINTLFAQYGYDK